MKNITTSIFAFVALVLSLGVAAAPCDNPEQLRFSFVPQSDVRKYTEAFQFLMERVETATDKPVTIVTPSSYTSVIEGLQSGSIDFAMLGPAAYAAAKKADPNIIAFATYAKKGGAFDSDGISYNSLLIVKAGSPFVDIASLRGATLALTDPLSTSGSVVPRHQFPKVVGKPLESYFSKIVYAGDHDHAALAVLKGQVDAAFVASEQLSNLVAANKAAPDNFKVLWRSAPITRDAFVYRNKLCAAIKEKIINVFLKSSAEQNKPFFQKYPALNFVPASDDDYRLIRELY